MKTEEDTESAPRTEGGQSKGKGKKKKSAAHLHIGPTARAFRSGKAFCPVCDADKILRLTEKEKEADRAVRDAKAAARTR